MIKAIEKLEAIKDNIRKLFLSTTKQIAVIDNKIAILKEEYTSAIYTKSSDDVNNLKNEINGLLDERHQLEKNKQEIHEADKNLYKSKFFEPLKDEIRAEIQIEVNNLDNRNIAIENEIYALYDRILGLRLELKNNNTEKSDIVQIYNQIKRKKDAIIRSEHVVVDSLEGYEYKKNIEIENSSGEESRFQRQVRISQKFNQEKIREGKRLEELKNKGIEKIEKARKEVKIKKDEAKKEIAK